MQKEHIVTINGRQYDALTGLLVDQSTDSANDDAVMAPALVRAVRHSSAHGAAVHAPVLQRSQTLRRRAAAKPAAAAITPKPTPEQSSHTAITPKKSPAAARQNSIQRSPSISRFAPHPVPQQKQPLRSRSMNDIAPIAHPAAVKAHAVQTQKVTHAITPRAPKPATVIKDEAIENALANAVQNTKEHKRPKKQQSRWMAVASSCFAILLLGGYFTYLNMPNLSVRVAAAQAGFDASYPEYKPDGYRLNGPIAAENGKVSMKFASNSGPQNFLIQQEKSSWDSMAVQQYIDDTTGAAAVTTTVDGLTIYLYGSNAAWVNGGVLYTLSGDARLSGEQVRRIATSM